MELECQRLGSTNPLSNITLAWSANAYSHVADVDGDTGAARRIGERSGHGDDGPGQRLATFAWSSSVSGAFGGGQADFTLSSLGVGTHTITVTVSDDQTGGGGDVGTAQITLIVLPPDT